MPTIAMRPEDKDYAVSFAVPVDTPGIFMIVGRQSCDTRKLEGVNVITNRPVSLGGDNFAEYQQKVPGVYAYLGTRDPENPNTALAHHNDGFDLGRRHRRGPVD